MTPAPVQRIAIDSKGIARIAGSRSRVSQIVVDHRQMSPEEIVQTYPHLTLADVHAALAYYYDHQAQIDAEIQRGDALADQMRAQMEPQNREVIERLRARARGQ